MKPALRCSLVCAAAVSLVTVALWVRSYRTADVLDSTDTTSPRGGVSTIALASSRGTVTLSLSTLDAPPDRVVVTSASAAGDTAAAAAPTATGWRHASTPIATGPRVEPVPLEMPTHFGGFAYAAARPDPTDAWPAGWTFLAVPWWSLALAAPAIAFAIAVILASATPPLVRLLTRAFSWPSRRRRGSRPLFDPAAAAPAGLAVEQRAA